MRRQDVEGHVNELTGKILEGAYRVHSALGNGLLERIYHACLVHELRKAGLEVHAEVAAPVVYDGVRMDGAYRIDLLVERCVIVEVKAVHAIDDVYRAQVLSYLKLSGCSVGLLLDFRTPHLKDGIERFVCKPQRSPPRDHRSTAGGALGSPRHQGRFTISFVTGR